MFDTLFRFLGRPRPAARRKPRTKAPPSLEALEDRWVPSATDGLSMQSLLGGSFSSTPLAGVTQTTDLGAPPPLAVNSPTTPAQTPGGTMPNAPMAPTPAATQTQQVTATFSPFTTGGSRTQTVAQFNPALGTLTGVQVILNGTLTSHVRVESFDGAPSNFAAQVNGNLQLQGPGMQSLAVNPSLSENAQLTAFDGVIDFGGTSGHDFGAQSAQASKSVTLTAGQNNLSAWLGTGSVSLTESAQSSSTMAGSGNEDTQVCSEGSGTVQVIYSYTPNVAPQSPPPAPPPASPPPAPPPCMSPPPASPPASPQSPPPAPPPPSPPPTTCTTPTGPGSIGGIVYVDAGHQGHYITTDTGVGGVTVNLTGVTVTGQSVNRTTATASDGTYSFTNLQAGIYTLSDVQPSNYTAGALNLGSLGGVVQNNQMILALPQGGFGMCYDFGELPPPSPPPAPPPSPPPSPPPASNGGVVPLSPPVSPPASPPPGPTIDPFPFPGAISKRSLIGNGWQSLG